MEIDIISFGKISEFIHNQSLTLQNVGDSDELKHYLEQAFPQLAEMKYVIAIDKQIVQKNIELNNKAIVAIMPPFSGG